MRRPTRMQLVRACTSQGGAAPVPAVRAVGGGVRVRVP